MKKREKEKAAGFDMRIQVVLSRMLEEAAGLCGAFTQTGLQVSQIVPKWLLKQLSKTEESHLFQNKLKRLLLNAIFPF